MCRDRGGRLRRLLGLGRGREPPPEPFQYDWRRTARLATFGAAVAGPMGHGWFTLLDRYVLPSAPRRSLPLACCLDMDWARAAHCINSGYFTGVAPICLRSLRRLSVVRDARPLLLLRCHGAPSAPTGDRMPCRCPSGPYAMSLCLAVHQASDVPLQTSQCFLSTYHGWFTDYDGFHQKGVSAPSPAACPPRPCEPRAPRGPAAHCNGLPAECPPPCPCSIPAVALKMVVDQALMAPFGCALFYSVQGVLSGAPASVLPTLREKFARDPGGKPHRLMPLLEAARKPQAADLQAWFARALEHTLTLALPGIVACTLHMRRIVMSVSAMLRSRGILIRIMIAETLRCRRHRISCGRRRTL